MARHSRPPPEPHRRPGLLPDTSRHLYLIEEQAVRPYEDRLALRHKMLVHPIESKPGIGSARARFLHDAVPESRAACRH